MHGCNLRHLLGISTPISLYFYDQINHPSIHPSWLLEPRAQVGFGLKVAEDMDRSPEFWTTHLLLLLLAFLAFSGKVVSGEEEVPSPGFNGTERDALLALSNGFNSSLLKRNWTSIMCYLNQPPRWLGIQCRDGRVTGIFLENMALSGKIKADALANLTLLSLLSFKNNSIAGTVMDFSHNPRLTKIDLSMNGFHGPIPDSLLGLNFLESLRLQDNELDGSIPALNQSSLRYFDVSNNRLSGQVPNTTLLQSFNSSSFLGNPRLCGPPTSTACNFSDNSTSSSKKSHFIDTLIVVVAIAMCIVLFLFVVYYRKYSKLKKQMKSSSRSLQDTSETGSSEDQVEDVEKSGETREGSGAGEGEEKGRLVFMDQEGSFELKDLLKASAQALGNGNFGACYKAKLCGEEGAAAAAVVVKRMRDLKPLSKAEFEKLLQPLADWKHPNLLPLLAYYYSKEEKLLIFKFAANGNVFNRIHGGRGTNNRIPFRWPARLAVAHGAALALEYLHLNSNSPAGINVIPHGNLKSTNVLLDETDTVLVSDYGLTSIVAVQLAAQRMAAYKSPEYQSHKMVFRKSDVWCYGSFLLELLTGRVSAHAAQPGIAGVDLCSWVHRAVREEWTAEIFDLEILVRRSPNHSMIRLLELAIRCCDKLPEKRPEMSEVVREVERIAVAADSEDEDDQLSVDQSLTDESLSASQSIER
ncbi:probable inactive receptor kinase At2g26730 [Diospyros lotus]|uniref:probable inactive receptor kinase At2g26730 n=1 Tax=Diospyros lotus TaxID=55363 RepID=UPI00225BF04B|nr:probable inactive receptor kinase At2g26730 [Diospyros lotus]